MTAPRIAWRWMGRWPYEDALLWQAERREAVVEGRREPLLALLEHDRVVTVGRRPAPGLDRVLAAGLPVVPTGRGGFATWHGPGQLVGYPIVSLPALGIGVRAAVRALEDGLVGWCRAQGAPATRREGLPGVWIGEAKVGSIGIHVRRGVVMHGFALNLGCDLADFDLFAPCGLQNVRMTRLSDHGVALGPAAAAAGVAQAVLTSLTR